MDKSYKFRIYPTKEQEELIQKTFGCVRFVFNYFLAERIEQYKNVGKSPNRFQQDKSLTSLKQKFEWLQEVDSRALKASLKDLDSAYQNFFRQIKHGKKIGYPKFKSKHRDKKSYRSSGLIKVTGETIQIPKLGKVKCRISEEVKGHVVSATVTQNPSGKYFVSIVCTDVEIEPFPKTGAVVGVDLGIKDLAITSDGVKYHNPKYLSKAEKKLARLQRELSRKSSGSNRREKARIRLARQYEKIANQRMDNLHKITTELVRNYDVICIENLAPQNMAKNHKLAKAVRNASFGAFRIQIEYKANWYGKEVVRVDRFYPSSQLCSNCGEKNVLVKDLGVREWDCPNCGEHHDRDVNAAINILNEGLRILG